MSAALVCPWCGAVLDEQPETCPHCGAALVERDAAPEPDAAGNVVVPVDPELGGLAPSVGQQLTTSPDADARSRTAPARAVLGQVIGADPKLAEAVGSSPFRPDEAEEGVGFPSDDVRREMLRMQLDAERAALEAEAAEYEYVVPDEAASGAVGASEPAASPESSASEAAEPEAGDQPPRD